MKNDADVISLLSSDEEDEPPTKKPRVVFIEINSQEDDDCTFVSESAELLNRKTENEESNDLESEDIIFIPSDDVTHNTRDEFIEDEHSGILKGLPEKSHGKEDKELSFEQILQEVKDSAKKIEETLFEQPKSLACSGGKEKVNEPPHKCPTECALHLYENLENKKIILEKSNEESLLMMPHIEPPEAEDDSSINQTNGCKNQEIPEMSEIEKRNNSRLEESQETILSEEPYETEDLFFISEKPTTDSDKEESNETEANNISKVAQDFLSICQDVLRQTNDNQTQLDTIDNIHQMIIENPNTLNCKSVKNFFIKYKEKPKEGINSTTRLLKKLEKYILQDIEWDKHNVPEKKKPYLKKLEYHMNVLLKALKKIDSSEVDFEDENNSMYEKRAAYAKRLIKVHEQYCKTLKMNPNKQRATHQPIKFNHSKYDEINLAISKKYKNNEVFPSFEDFSRCIEKFVRKQSLEISEAELQYELKQCFEHLGNILQKRRKKDLYQIHYSLIKNTPDPATKGSEIESKLKENRNVAKVKMENLCQEFVKKQELAERNQSTENNCESSIETTDEDD